MSGGSYDYKFRDVQEMVREIRLRAGDELCGEGELSLKEREDFACFLELVATAMHELEWLDSGDTSTDDVQLVRMFATLQREQLNNFPRIPCETW